MPTPSIRPIVDADLERILDVNQSNVPEVGPLQMEPLRFLVAESAIARAVEVDGAIAGFCLVLGPGSTYDSVNYTWFMQRYPTSMYLDRVALDEVFQRQGLGRALYTHVEFEMRTHFPDAASLTLEVNVEPPNEPSLRFHERLGFVEVGRQMSHGIEVSLMSKPL